MSAGTGATAGLAARIHATGYDDIPEAARVQARHLALDGLAVAVAGSKQEAPPAILAAHAREMGGAESASAIGFAFRTSPVQAALVNGASMHVLDFEAMWNPANHQTSTTLPAALALAEARGLDGRSVLTAFVKGIETQGWIRQASRQFEPSQFGFHPPGQVGPMGAAVAAGHLLRLDVEGLRNALAIAASRAGSLLANAGTMTKSTNCGVAVAGGLEAALLAARGFTGNPDIIEADKGYVAGLFDDGFDFEALSNYGPPFRIVEPGYALKMYPSQYGTHFAITAALALREELDDVREIETLTLVTPSMPYIDRPDPVNGLAGKFSWQYTAAAALLDGHVAMASFEDERRFAPDMAAMLARITVDARADIPARFDAMHVEVRARLKNGEEVSTRSDGPPGIWGGTPVPEEAHLAKVRDCLAVRLDAAVAGEVVGLARRLDDLSAEDVGRLMDLVGRE